MDNFQNSEDYVVACAEMARGNGEIGEMWLETNIFSRWDNLDTVISWAEKIECSGRLIITVPTIREE